MNKRLIDVEKRCRCRKRVIDELGEECSENINENEIIYNGSLNDYEKVCNSCTLCIVLLVIFIIISITISSAFIYFHWSLKRSMPILILVLILNQ